VRALLLPAADARHAKADYRRALLPLTASGSVPTTTTAFNSSFITHHSPPSLAPSRGAGASKNLLFFNPIPSASGKKPKSFLTDHK